MVVNQLTAKEMKEALEAHCTLGEVPNIKATLLESRKGS